MARGLGLQPGPGGGAGPAARGLGLPAGSGALCYADGSVHAIGACDVILLTLVVKPRKQLLRACLVPSVAAFEPAFEQPPLAGIAEQEAGSPAGAVGQGAESLPSALWHGPQRTAVHKLEAAVRALAGCRRLVAFTGAGISAESGLPTYRETVSADEEVGPDGKALADPGGLDALTPLWSATDPSEAADISHFHADPKAWWVGERRVLRAFESTRPNPAHKALASLQDAGLLLGVVTQNIDGLHQAAGVDKVVELHGTVHRLECAGVPIDRFGGSMGGKGGDGGGMAAHGEGTLSAAEEFRRAMQGTQKLDDRCGWSCEMDVAKLDAAEAKGAVASCPQCGGYLKTATVLFGEPLPTSAQKAACDLMMGCDGLLIVGTSLNGNCPSA